MELISKEQIKKDDEKEYILELNLNAIRPKINFGKVNINTPVERTLLIKNVQNKQIKINVNNKELNINNLKLCINKQEHTPLKIKWQPKEAQNLNCSIRFEVTNATRLNFIVKVVGVCVGLEAPVIQKHKYNPSMYAYIYESNDEEDQTDTRLKNNEGNF
jgi:hypothetical protein